MMSKQSLQDNYIMMTLDDIVPHDSKYRLIEKHVDFEFIYEVTKPLYSHTGKPSVDPVNIFKIEMINILEGYNSIRKTCDQLVVNVEYRWFLGIPFGQNTPHFSTLSQLYKRKFEETDVYQTIFTEIMKQLIKHDLINTTNIYIDGTHIKANANKKKFEKVEIEKPENVFIDEILEAVNESRINDGMKPFEKQAPEMKTIKKSTVDPECGYFVKGEKEKQMAYVAQVVCDENGYALDADVVAGNIHDSQSCKEVLERVLDKHEVNAVAADSGYKTGPIAQMIFSYNALFYTAYTRPKTKEGMFKSYEYVYDEFTGDVLCPNDKILTYKRTTREGYKLYESEKKDCVNCWMKDKCTTQDTKIVFKSVFDDILEEVEHLRHTDEGREVYKKRKEKIERLFADGKDKYGMRYTRLRGRNRVRNHILLTLACMNIKKMAFHLERRERTAQ